MSFEISLHLGVHRSASSFVQSFVQDACFEGTSSGRYFWGPEILRKVFGRGESDFTTELGTKFIGTKRFEAVKAMLADDIADLEKSEHSGLILSDENFLGTMAANFRNRSLYPNVATKLAGLAAILPFAPRDIYISIREYASYWASSYAFVRVRNDVEEFDEIRGALFDQERRWTDVIAAVAEVFPTAKIHVWAYKEDNSHLVAPLSEILGRRLQMDEIATRPNENVGLNSAQFSTALALRQESPHAPNREIIEVAKTTKQRGKRRKFQPFSWPEVRRLRRRFARDIKELQGGVVPNVIWIGDAK